jgi:hypothetical protein
MFKKLFGGLSELSWTLGGTGLVLITLSGETQKWGFWITVGSLVAYLIGNALSDKDGVE